jgi:hypothetical protein
MKKAVFLIAGGLVFSTILFAKVVAPPEHYCKNDRARNTGICGISSDGTANCYEVTQTVNKDCYGSFNN